MTDIDIHTLSFMIMVMIITGSMRNMDIITLMKSWKKKQKRSITIRDVAEKSQLYSDKSVYSCQILDCLDLC